MNEPFQNPRKIMQKFRRIRELPKDERKHLDYYWRDGVDRMSRCEKILEDLNQITANALMDAKKPENRGPSEDHIRLLMNRQVELTHHGLDMLEWMEENGEKKEELENHREVILKSLEETLTGLHLALRRTSVEPGSN